MSQEYSGCLFSVLKKLLPERFFSKEPTEEEQLVQLKREWQLLEEDLTILLKHLPEEVKGGKSPIEINDQSSTSIIKFTKLDSDRTNVRCDTWSAVPDNRRINYIGTKTVAVITIMNSLNPLKPLSITEVASGRTEQLISVDSSYAKGIKPCMSGKEAYETLLSDSGMNLTPKQLALSQKKQEESLTLDQLQLLCKAVEPVVNLLARYDHSTL